MSRNATVHALMLRFPMRRASSIRSARSDRHPVDVRMRDAQLELIVYDNKEGNPPAPTDIWHTDETFREAPPMSTALCSKDRSEVGGDTAFASMTAVYDGLSDRWQRFLSGLEAVHDFSPSAAYFPATVKASSACAASRTSIPW